MGRFRGALARHAQRRVSQRAISLSAIGLALRHGRRIQQDGAIVYYLGWRDLPDTLPPAARERLEGLTIVTGRDGLVITAFRTRALPRRMFRRGVPAAVRRAATRAKWWGGVPPRLRPGSACPALASRNGPRRAAG